MLIAQTHVELGDEILVAIDPELNPKPFGSDVRIGTVTELGTDILFNAPMLGLDDGGPRIYDGHIRWVSIVTRSDR